MLGREGEGGQFSIQLVAHFHPLHPLHSPLLTTNHSLDPSILERRDLPHPLALVSDSKSAFHSEGVAIALRLLGGCGLLSSGVEGLISLTLSDIGLSLLLPSSYSLLSSSPSFPRSLPVFPSATSPPFASPALPSLMAVVVVVW